WVCTPQTNYFETSSKALILTTDFGSVVSKAGAPKSGTCTNGVIMQALSSADLQIYLSATSYTVTLPNMSW
ncbi:9627_t:CDS:2, partial [Paraglomus brasilianum]